MLSQISVVDLEKEEREAYNLNTIYGVFTCLKLLIPSIELNSVEQGLKDNDCTFDHYFCIYESCLFYVKFYTNHNVINAALEAMVQLFQNLPENVVAAFLSKNGLGWHTNKLKDRGRQWPSKSSLSTNVMSETNAGSTSNLFEDSMIDIPEGSPKVKDWISDIPDVTPTKQNAWSEISYSDSFRGNDDRPKYVEEYSELIIGNLDCKNFIIQNQKIDMIKHFFLF